MFPITLTSLAVPGVSDVLGELGSGILVPEALGVDGLVKAVSELRSGSVDAGALVETAKRDLARYRPESVATTLRDAYRAAGASRRGSGLVLASGLAPQEHP